MSQRGVRGALAWILCLAACDAGAKPEAAPTPKPIIPASTAPEKAVASSGDYDLRYLPADSDVVVHVDVALLRKSALWSTYSKDVARLVAPGFSECEYAPLEHATSVDIGVPLESHLNVYVVRGIDRDKTMACLHGFENRSPAAGPVATIQGDFATITNTVGGIEMTRVLSFVDAHTMVMQGSAQPTVQTLQLALQRDADGPLRKDVTFMGALTKSRTAAAVTAVSRPGSKAMQKQMDQSNQHLTYFWGSIDLTDRFELKYAMDMNSPKDASELEKTMQAQFSNAQVKALFDRIEVHAQDHTVSFELALGEPKLGQLVGMLRAMLPA